MCLYARILALEWRERAFMEKVNSRCLSWFSVDLIFLCTKTVHQYGVSIQSSTKVRETFRQITQKLRAKRTWESFITFHFLGFFDSAVSNIVLVSCLLRDCEKRSISIDCHVPHDSDAVIFIVHHSFWLTLVPFVCNLDIMIFTDAPVEIGCSFIVRGDVLCLANTSHSDTICATVSLCCEQQFSV